LDLRTTFYNKCGEILEQDVQRSCGCSMVGSVQNQSGWGFEQPDLVEHVPVHGRGLDYMILKGSFQPKPFYDSVNI